MATHRPTRKTTVKHPPTTPEKPWLDRLQQAARDDALQSLRKLENELAASKAKLRAEAAKRRQAEAELNNSSAHLDLVLATQDKASAKNLSDAAKRAKTISPGDAAAVLLWSDWHCNEGVEPSAIDYCNAFNPDICAARIDRLLNKSIELIEFSRGLSRIREVVCWLGGDFMGGNIHTELAEEASMGPADEIIYVQDKIIAGLSFLKKHLKFPLRVVTSCGNHARQEREKRWKGAHNHSHEYVIYRNVERAFAKEPGIAFQVGIGYLNFMRIFNYDVAFQHGDALRYMGGVGGLHIPLRRAIGRWSARRRASLWCLGHYHQFLSDVNYCVNGSLIGMTDWAFANNFEWQPPIQALNIIGPPYCKLLSVPIFLSSEAEQKKYGIVERQVS